MVEEASQQNAAWSGDACLAFLGGSDPGNATVTSTGYIPKHHILLSTYLNSVLGKQQHLLLHNLPKA